jgi:hypothetical protein
MRSSFLCPFNKKNIPASMPDPATTTFTADINNDSSGTGSGLEATVPPVERLNGGKVEIPATDDSLQLTPNLIFSGSEDVSMEERRARLCVYGLRPSADCSE